MYCVQNVYKTQGNQRSDWGGELPDDVIRNEQQYWWLLAESFPKRKYQCGPKSESYRKKSELVGDWRQRLELITPYGKEYYLIRVRGF